jgi:hypothetical protein
MLGGGGGTLTPGMTGPPIRVLGGGGGAIIAMLLVPIMAGDMGGGGGTWKGLVGSVPETCPRPP